MPFVRNKARILERSITAGNGPYALAGAVDISYNSFASFMAVGDTTYGSVIEPGVAFWTGIITYSATNEITLTTVEETKGTFGIGTKEIMAGPLASTTMFREDIAGAIITGGSSTAYTVASYRKYDTLTQLNGNLIAFTPHTTNGAIVTLNLDGLGAKPLRAAPSTDLMPGVLIQGSPYLALYNHSDQVFYLHGFFGNPYNVPLGAGMDYWLPTAPNSAFVFPIGQAINRATYAPLFAQMGTTYGAGDGSTTFNLPDKTGRVSAMKEASASRLTSAVSGVDGATLGSANSAQSKTLTVANFPPYTPAGSISNGGIAISGGTSGRVAAGDNNNNGGGGGPFSAMNSTPLSLTASQASSTFTGSAQGGTSTPVSIVQPTIICNYIMRVL